MSSFWIYLASGVDEVEMSVLYYLTLQATKEGQAGHAHVHEIISGLRQRGWEVFLFEPNYSSSYENPAPLRRILEFIRVQMRLWLRKKPDVIYIRGHFAAWPTALIARLRRIPVVQEVNGPYEDLFLAWPFTRRMAWLFTWLIRSQLRWADAIITVTPQLAEWVRKEVKVAKKIEVIPNGANTDLFHPFAKARGILPLRRPYVIFFGALAPWQGIDLMLKAVEHANWPKEVTLLIVGDGAERAKVEEAARQGKVQYIGVQPYKEMPGIIAGALAALSSSQIGQKGEKGLFPLKVFEALACGVPVIVTDFPGMADLVRTGGCGLVIPPGDHEALAWAVRHLYENPDLRHRMGEAGRRLVKEEHSWDKRAADTDQVLRSLLVVSVSQ